MRAKVAICIPSGVYWSAHTAVCHSELSVFSTINDIAVKTICRQCSQITMSRNMHVREALGYEPKATHIMWIDSDMKFSPNALVRLLDHDKDIVGAFYNKRTPPYETVGHLIDASNLADGGLRQADVMPGGFVLVKREVYEKLSPPWYRESYDLHLASEGDPDGTVGEDVNFSRAAIAAGYDIWCDLDITYEMGHVGEIVVPCARPSSDAAAFSVAQQPAAAKQPATGGSNAA